MGKKSFHGFAALFCKLVLVTLLVRTPVFAGQGDVPAGFTPITVNYGGQSYDNMYIQNGTLRGANSDYWQAVGNPQA